MWELRRVTITNRTLRTRHIELTSYVELAMAAHNTDRAHPAFAKLFVQTECVGGRILLAHRRPRSTEDPTIWTGHLMVGSEGAPIQFETDRYEFLGRANSPASAGSHERRFNRHHRHRAGPDLQPANPPDYGPARAPGDHVRYVGSADA